METGRTPERRARGQGALSALFALLLCISLLYTDAVHASAAEAEGPKIAAKAFALIDAVSGRVLAQSSGDVALPMASTTKVMTALVVLENADLDDIVLIDNHSSGIEGSSMYLEAGERLSVEALLCGLMLRSGNDAAVALARHVAGDTQGFVDMMNEKAREMGLENTAFKNPHGLPAQGHVTSALDLCAIMAEAMRHPDFVRICGERRVQVPWDGHPWDRVMTNKNRLLDELEGCIAGKTGFTSAAGRCLVQGVERGGMRLVGALLNCPDWWNQMVKLVEYGYETYGAHGFIERGEVVHTARTGGLPARVDVLARDSMVIPVLEGEELALRIWIPRLPRPPYLAGEELGTAWALVDGEAVASVRLIARHELENPK